MKHFLVLLFLTIILTPVYSAEISVYGAESAKELVRPDYSRFQYDLPEGKSFGALKRKFSKQQDNSFDEITLDEDDIKPVKKVIKRIQPQAEPKKYDPNSTDNPMNYDNFPKFYNPNDLMNQQFMPTATF